MTKREVRGPRGMGERHTLHSGTPGVVFHPYHKSAYVGEGRYKVLLRLGVRPIWPILERP